MNNYIIKILDEDEDDKKHFYYEIFKNLEFDEPFKESEYTYNDEHIAIGKAIEQLENLEQVLILAIYILDECVYDIVIDCKSSVVKAQLQKLSPYEGQKRKSSNVGIKIPKQGRS